MGRDNTLFILSAVILVAFAFINNSHSMSVFTTVMANNNIKKPLVMTVENNPEENAYCDYRFNTLVMYSGMIKGFKNVDEMALVIGHEIAHCILRHNKSNYQNEFAADRLGAKYMVRAGYNKCRGAQHMKRRNAPNGPSHPSDIDRISAIGC